MTRAICLRCDWDAELGADPGDGARDEGRRATPARRRTSTAAALAAARRSTSPRPSLPPRTRAAPSGDRGPVAIPDHRESWSGSEPGESRRRVAPLGLAVPMVILASIVAVWSLAGGGGGRPLAAARPGRLVYDGVGAGGDRRLWELDLSSRDGAPRPRVRRRLRSPVAPGGRMERTGLHAIARPRAIPGVRRRRSLGLRTSSAADLGPDHLVGPERRQRRRGPQRDRRAWLRSRPRSSSRI